MKKPLVPVTDHAVIRYLERVLNIDIESHRRAIGHRVDMAVAMGASAIIIDGFRYILSDGHVISIVEVNTPNMKTGRQRAERGE